MFLTLLLSFAFAGPVSADDSLGLGVRIENDPEATELYMGNRLWFGIEPGEQKTRSFVITSRSEIPQEINLYLFDKKFLNGQASVDESQLSATSEWAKFEPSALVLLPGQEQRFTMTYQVPVDAPDIAFNSVLRVVATSAQEATGAEDAASAVVRGAAAVELGVFLGIGDALDLVPDFNIESIRGVRLPEGRFLEVELRNSGRVPVQLVGTVQLADPVFAERNFGPFDFLSREIFPDESVIAQVPMPDEVEPGEWKIFVTAEYGQIKQTRLFEQSLSFLPPGSQLTIWDWVLRVGLSLLLAAGVVVGIRLLRSRPTADPSAEIAVAKKPIKPRTPTKAAAKPASPEVLVDLTKKTPARKPVASKPRAAKTAPTATTAKTAAPRKRTAAKPAGETKASAGLRTKTATQTTIKRTASTSTAKPAAKSTKSTRVG